MSEPTDQGGNPPPDTPPDRLAALDAREEFFTATLQRANRIVNTAEAVRLQLMLAGMDAMLLEEQEQTGTMPGPRDSTVTGFYLHQANELHLTRNDVEHRLDAARILRDHLPRTWAAFLEGLTSEQSAVAAGRQAIGLSPEHFAEFDAEAVTLVQEERPSVVERELSDLRDRLEPDETTERHKSAAERRHVRAWAEGEGMAALTIHSTAADIAAAYDRIRKHAVEAHGREGECRTLGTLMADLAIDAILTGRMRGAEDGGPSYPNERLGETDQPLRTVIDATILVTIPARTATGATNEPAKIAGMGTIDAETARVIVQHTETWTRALVDPVDKVVLGIDSKERYIPAGLKKLLHLLQPTCGCGCGLPAHRADIDHIVRVEHDGRTRHDNLQILCRKAHQGKDAGFADVWRAPDGRIAMRNKWGGVQYMKQDLAVRTEQPAPADEEPVVTPF